jgi:uncharacterized protein
MDQVPPGMLAALIALCGGVLLGLAARLGNFCTLNALETAIWGGDQRRLRLWGIALGVAIAGTWVGVALGQIDLSSTLFHAIAFNPAAAVVGGLLFGYGMALAGNCGFGALVRFGGGDLRSLVVLIVMGIFGYMALSGPLAPLRVALFPQADAQGAQGAGHAFAALTGLSPLLLALAIAALFMAWALAYAPLRADRRMVIWGAVAGAVVPLMFWGTSWVNDLSFGQIVVEGPSFTAPVGRTILFLMTSTSGGISYSVGSVLGVMLGAFAATSLRGRFRWEACEDPRELGRQVAGAALMGMGGVIALGCSVGQGLTGMATLAWSAPVTVAAIGLGGWLGLRRLIEGTQLD